MTRRNADDELELEKLKQFIIQGRLEETRQLADRALKAGVDARLLINSCLVPAMTEVGDLFESGEYFVPEMLIAARASGEILRLAEPYLALEGHEPAGVVVLGTVQGDLHDLGKNIVAMMLRGNGFRVVDLGTDVGPAKFIAAVREHHPDIIGMSALLTTTMRSVAATIEALAREGMRDRVRVMVGGAPLTDSFASAVGADGYAPNAAAAVRLAGALLAGSNR
jgi:5-methyltetrahydrofolate--homocysteine methyltransferase